MIVAAPTPEEGRQGASSPDVGRGAGGGNRGLDGSDLAAGSHDPCSPTSIASEAGRMGSLPAPSGSPGGPARRSVRPGSGFARRERWRTFRRPRPRFRPASSPMRRCGRSRVWRSRRARESCSNSPGPHPPPAWNRTVRPWKQLSREGELTAVQARHRRRAFSVFVDGDGMYVVKGRLEPEVGAMLMRAVEAAGDALYRREKDAEEKSAGEKAGEDSPKPKQRRADAVGLVAERALAAGFGDDSKEDATGESGTRAERYQVIIHADAATLAEEGEPGRADLDGVRVSAETSRRMACDAATVTMVHGEGAAVPSGSKPDASGSMRSVPGGPGSNGLVPGGSVSNGLVPGGAMSSRSVAERGRQDAHDSTALRRFSKGIGRPIWRARRRPSSAGSGGARRGVSAAPPGCLEPLLGG